MSLITDAEKLILSGSTKCFFYLRHFTAHSMKMFFWEMLKNWLDIKFGVI